jgi:hypothetical protein
MLFILLAMIFGGFLSWKEDECVGSTVIGVIIGGFFGVLLSTMFGLIAVNTVKTKNVVIQQHELIQLKLNSKVEGSFFLGCGSIENNQYYFGYTKDENGEISLNKYATDYAKIVYTEDVPKAQTIHKEPVNKIWSNIFVLLYKDYYRIFIPEDSIISSYDVNIK